MRAKKFLPLIVLVVLLIIVVGLGLLLYFYNPEKPVKINALKFSTSVGKNEVAKLFGNAVASRDPKLVLGASSPIEVKKEEPVKKAEFAFNAIAPVWNEEAPEGTDVTIQIRTSSDGQNWSEWRLIEKDDDGDAKDDVTSQSNFGNLVVVEGQYVQERLIFKTTNLNKIPEIKNLEIVYIDSQEKLNFFEKILKSVKLEIKKAFAASDVQSRPAQSPAICSRACWGADESIYVPGEAYASIKKVVVHHTATVNDDPNPKSTIRAIYYFHNVVRGWGDIGYNFLVDTNGTIYEGRYGGDSVIGAHARGYNTGSAGVAVLGDFRYNGVNKKIQNALHKIAVWKFSKHNVDPEKYTTFGSPALPLPPVFYHGTVGATSCAGTHLNIFVPNIRKLARYMPQQILVRDSSGTRKIVGSSSNTVSDLLDAYKNDGSVAPNYIRKVTAFPSDGITPPNDPNYSSQWDLPNLNALSVWQQSTGGVSSVKVAVLDTGVAYEDYNPAGSENYAKGPDFGSTNFVAGYDYINLDTHPDDDYGHGTAVASVIAGSTNNSEGSASLAYNVSIMPIKICDLYGWCLDSEVAQGIDFARSNGAKVINMSIGGPDYSSVIQSAIDSAWNAGAVVVAASGNDGQSGVLYPGRGSHVIGVGALTSSNARAFYSNYGSGLDLSAPGGDGSGGSGDLLYQLVECTAGLDCTSFSYARIAGTSFAAPLVSASAALLVGQGTVWPDSVERFLKFKAQDLGFPGFDNIYGWGKVQPADTFSLSNGELPHPNGVLIKSANDPKIYLIDSGQKRWIPNRVIFEELFRWGKVVVVTDFELNTYGNGSDVTFPDGVLIRKGSTAPVYVLSNGAKRWVSTRSVFDSLGYNIGKVHSISDSVFNNYPTGPDLISDNIHPDGALIRQGSNSFVYLIDSGQKRWIPNRVIFESRFFWDDVISVSDSEFNSYPNGSNVTISNGSLVRGINDPNQKVYIISTEIGSTTQTRHHVFSRITFEGLGFKWENINNVSTVDINNFADGRTIY